VFKALYTLIGRLRMVSKNHLHLHKNTGTFYLKNTSFVAFFWRDSFLRHQQQQRCHFAAHTQTTAQALTHTLVAGLQDNLRISHYSLLLPFFYLCTFEQLHFANDGQTNCFRGFFDWFHWLCSTICCLVCVFLCELESKSSGENAFLSQRGFHQHYALIPGCFPFLLHLLFNNLTIC